MGNTLKIQLPKFLTGHFVALLLGMSALLTGACTTTGSAVGTKSPLASLGAPTMVATSLGRLAVWDTDAQGSETPIVLWPSIFSDHVIFSSLSSVPTFSH
jgi:hypothetical protein